MIIDFDSLNIASVASDPAAAQAALTSITAELRRLRRANEVQREQIQANRREFGDRLDDLRQENGALHYLLEKAGGLSELVLGRGLVQISIGKVEDKAVLLLEPLASRDEPVPAIGKPRGTGAIKPGSASLVIEGQAGLDALMKAVELAYLELTGDYSPAHRLLRTCVEFVEDQHVTCAEATVEDRVYEHAPELVEAIAEIVGYYKDEDEDDEDDAPAPPPATAHNPTAHRIGERPITVYEDGV